MRDQVASLTELGVTAAMIGASLFEDEQIQRGDVSVVFGSPLEKRLQQSRFRDHVVAVVADEVHCVVQWLACFAQCFDVIRMELTDELPTSYYDCIVQPNAVRLMV